MEEYICKNAAREKPCSVRLFEFHLEWQRGEETGTFDYPNIVSIRLERKGKKFRITIESDYQGTLTLTNRFYLSKLKFEDRSRQYNTFVRVLHHHLKKLSTSSFLTGSRWSTLASIIGSLVLGAWLLQISMAGDAWTNLWFIMADVAVISLAAVLLTIYRPRAYLPENIPMEFLP
jgi:hypothetical protein